MERGHDLIDGDLGGNAGDQGGDHEQVADQAVAGELEAVEHIGQHGGDEHAAGQHADQNKEAVDEGVAHIGLLPCGLEVLKVQPALGGGHDAGGGVFLGGLEGGDHAGNDGYQRHKGRKDQEQVF